MKIIFCAGKQLIKIRFIMLVFLVFSSAMIWLGIDTFQSYGLRPADGGVLAPLAVRLAWFLVISLLGLSLPIVMWLYAECYILKIEFDEQTRMLNVYTLRLFGSKKHEIHTSRILRSEYHSGRSTFDSSINAPWWVTYVKDRKLPLIIDARRKFIEKNLTHRLFRL
jgi:hypothetical protein